VPLLQEGKATVAAETVPLLGLAQANAELVLDLQCRRPVKTATLDVDATVIHCDKPRITGKPTDKERIRAAPTTGRSASIPRRAAHPRGAASPWTAAAQHESTAPPRSARRSSVQGMTKRKAASRLNRDHEARLRLAAGAGFRAELDDRSTRGPRGEHGDCAAAGPAPDTARFVSGIGSPVFLSVDDILRRTPQRCNVRPPDPLKER
jgi:hypothetical protein